MRRDCTELESERDLMRQALGLLVGVMLSLLMLLCYALRARF